MNANDKAYAEEHNLAVAVETGRIGFFGPSDEERAADMALLNSIQLDIKPRKVRKAGR